MGPDLVVIAIATTVTTAPMKAVTEKLQSESKFKLMFKLLASLPCG